MAWLLTVILLEAGSNYPGLGSSVACAETRFIPALTVSEKYDTNIFNAAEQFIPSDRTKWDLATSIAPSLRMLNPDRDIATDLTAKVTGNVFVNNPELGYIATNVNLMANADKFIGRLFPGAKLTVYDYFDYTPQPPAFLTGVQTAQGVPDIYTRGLQIAFAESTSNNVKAKGTYALFQGVNLVGEASYDYFSLGQVYVSQAPGATPVSGLVTTTLSWSAGPSVRLSRGDVAGLKYLNSVTDFTGGGVPDQTFTTHVVQVDYEGKTRYGTVKFSGGPGMIQPGGTLFYSGKLAFIGKYDQATTATVSLSRQAAPSLFGTLGALISNTVMLSGEHRFEKGVRLNGTVNYAQNESAPVANVRYEAFGGQLMVSYPLSKTMTTSLTYDYSRFKFVDSTIPGMVTGYEFDRSAVTFSIAFTWK